MVYEMNKSFVTKVLIMSTVLMAGILLIPTNIHDAKANPCSGMERYGRGGTGNVGGVLGLLGPVEMVEIEETLNLAEPVEAQEMLVVVQLVALEQVHSYLLIVPFDGTVLNEEIP